MVLMMCLSGCTLMRTDARLDYRPDAQVVPEVAEQLNGVSLRGVVVTDARKEAFAPNKRIEDPRVLLNKRNGHGHKMEGVYALDKPLADYVAQAFDAALLKAGVTRSAASPLELRVRLDILDDTVVRRGWTKSRTDLVLVAYVEVFNIDGGNEVWHKRYVGRAQIKHQGMVFVGIDDYVVTLPGTLNNLAAQCLATPEFRAAVKAAL
ncbi:hypothetical protein [Rhizobacter sp. Root1221]|uniref:hypothetical protein n=1 Tax=Rhizobacter sp. Root1221 TaxID=1736433 RepID=UPI0006FF15F2|nr:hypothetical protein [Rhizobacter sp. Root1221]